MALLPFPPVLASCQSRAPSCASMFRSVWSRWRLAWGRAGLVLAGNCCCSGCRRAWWYCKTWPRTAWPRPSVLRKLITWSRCQGDKSASAAQIAPQPRPPQGQHRRWNREGGALDPAGSNSGAGAYPTTAGPYRHDECRPEDQPSIPTSETMAGRRHGWRRSHVYPLEHITMSEKI